VLGREVDYRQAILNSCDPTPDSKIVAIEWVTDLEGFDLSVDSSSRSLDRSYREVVHFQTKGVNSEEH
jgi:hypothetical protein